MRRGLILTAALFSGSALLTFGLAYSADRAQSATLVAQADSASVETHQDEDVDKEEPTKRDASRVIVFDVFIIETSRAMNSEGLSAWEGGPRAIETQIAELRKQGELTRLQSARLTTLDQNLASLQFGERTPVIEGVNRFAGRGNSSPTVRVRYEDVGTMISLTPRTTATGHIVVDLKCERSQLAKPPKADQETSDVNSLPIPLGVETSSVQSTVRLDDGGSVVLGGMIVQGTRREGTTLVVLAGKINPGDGEGNVASRSQRVSRPQLRVYALKHASANDVANVLNSVYGEQRLRVKVDAKANRLTIFGDFELLQEIGELISRLDIQTQEPEVEIR